ncbi:MAG: DoxX family protein [Chitinophagaceae bacterium]|nr:DoxX family protein [Chitinophagaceae bacterium]
MFSAAPLWDQQGIALIRIITGFFLAYHGWELFSAEKMQGYVGWEMFKGQPLAKIMVYAGKAAELIGGLLLMIGFLTRIASVIVACTMLYISMFVGLGKIWYEDQHPFLFVLLALVFIFCGPGSWSLDKQVVKK